MNTIVLPAGLSSDLDWNLEEAKNSGEILWELDFAFSINDQAAFNAYVLAIDHFAPFWKEFADRSKGVVLYRGSLDIIRKIALTDAVEAANIFGDFLHRL